MIPNGGQVLENIVIEQLPTNTYRLNIDQKTISGQADGIEAMEQAIYLIFNTERFSTDILSVNYGVELLDLIGMPKDYCEAEIPRRITEALIQDDRINSVEEFTFEQGLGSILVSFTVRTMFGNIPIERTVAR